MEPIPYGRHSIDSDDIAAVVAALQPGEDITQGSRVRDFEEQLAALHGCRYAVAFNSGTAALHGAYFAAGVGQGDELITSAVTFVASANAGVYQGAFPVLCDIEMDSYNIDIDKIQERITDKTKVITPVSYAGNPVNIRKIAELASGKDITVIHDAAHAIGARLNGSSICDYADMTMLSFHPVKHVTTGEGGAILTNDADACKRLQLFRTHGITKDPAEFSVNAGLYANAGSPPCTASGPPPCTASEPPPWYYEMQELGYNYRIPDIQCALGISQLQKLGHSLYRRNQIAQIYDEAFQNLSWLKVPRNGFDRSWIKNGLRVVAGRPACCEGTHGNARISSFAQVSDLHAYHLYPVLVDRKVDRLDFFNYLRRNGILVQVHYIPVHYMPYYQRHFGCAIGDYPVAEDFYAREVSLPMYPALTDEQQAYVIETVKNFERGYARTYAD